MWSEVPEDRKCNAMDNTGVRCDKEFPEGDLPLLWKYRCIATLEKSDDLRNRRILP